MHIILNFNIKYNRFSFLKKKKQNEQTKPCKWRKTHLVSEERHFKTNIEKIVVDNLYICEIKKLSVPLRHQILFQI